MPHTAISFSRENKCVLHKSVQNNYATCVDSAARFFLKSPDVAQTGSCKMQNRYCSVTVGCLEEQTVKPAKTAAKKTDGETAAKKKKTDAVKEKPVAKKSKTLKEKQLTEEEVQQNEKKPGSAATKNKQTKKAATKTTDVPSNENVTKRKVTKSKQETAESKKSKENPGTSKKNTGPTKAKRSKKENAEIADAEADVPEETVEAPAKTNKAPKRKVAKSKEEESQPEENDKKTKKNATATAWENINFECNSKTSSGDATNFHITSWNVDGIRAWLKKGGLELLKYDQPNIVCIQETKCSQEKLPEELNSIEGYEAYWCSSDKEGYAGVGVLTKIKPLNVVYGIGSEEHDIEGRSITLEYENFFLVNVYVPNAGRKLVTLPKRLEWNKAFKSFVKKLDEKKPVIICGDMNVAHTEIDLANPKTNTKNPGFTVEEREGMTDFLGDGYVDTFRQLYPEKEKAYTFWTYMANARSKNVGWRLDYFIVSERFMASVCDNVIFNDVLGSDHCPITLYLSI